MISIWFFIGVLLLAYGVLIFGAGIYEWSSPPEHPWCCAELHAGSLVGRPADRAGRHSTRFKFAPGKGN